MTLFLWNFLFSKALGLSQLEHNFHLIVLLTPLILSICLRCHTCEACSLHGETFTKFIVTVPSPLVHTQSGGVFDLYSVKITIAVTVIWLVHKFVCFFGSVCSTNHINIIPVVLWHSGYTFPH